MVVQSEILTLGKIRQEEDHQVFQTRLGYVVKPCLKTNNSSSKRQATGNNFKILEYL